MTLRRCHEGSGGRTLVVLFVLAALAVVPLASQGAVTIRAFLTADRTTVDPGDVVTFSVSMNNNASASAQRAWLNLTLPSMTHLGDNAASFPFFIGSGTSGSRRYYNFTNVPTGNHTFTLQARVNVGPADGAVLTTRLAVNYTDEFGVRQPESTAARSVTVRTPNVSVTKTPSATAVDPGDPLSYTIRVVNSGNTSAKTIWLNDTLPPEVTFVRSQPGGFCTGLNCSVSNLGTGKSRTFDIVVQVRPTAPRGTVFVNRVTTTYTDDDGTILATFTRQASAEVRSLRDLVLDKVSDASVAFPRAEVGFTIWYNNTAGADVRDAWLNDTLPAGLTFVSASPPATLNGGQVQWQFPTVAPGPHSVRLVVRVEAGAGDGTVFVNRVTAEYTNASGFRAPRLNASAAFTVSVTTPLFDTFAKLADRAIVGPGGTVGYTIWFNNTGAEPAALVVIRDTIPPGTTLTNPSLPFDSVTDRTYEWRRANVTVGTNSLTYLLVLLDVAGETNLVNFASLNSTDASGRPLPSVPPRSAVVRVSESAAAPGGSVLPFLLLAALAAGGAGAFYYLRRPRTVIDEVFLLHKDGLLIKHYTRRVRPDVDSDILSGMLIAVQNFVNESFLGSEGLGREGRLDELRFGEFKIVIERGEWVIVAAALSGDPTDRVKEQVRAAIADLEASLGPQLEGWSGDMRSVEGADRYIQDLIGGRYGRPRLGKG